MRGAPTAITSNASQSVESTRRGTLRTISLNGNITFSVTHNPTVYTIVKPNSDGTKTYFKSYDGGDTFGIYGGVGGSGNAYAYWRFRFIRDANNIVSLMAQRVSGPNPVGSQRHLLDAAIDAANCAVYGVVATGLGGLLGNIVGKAVGAPIGFVIGIPLGPVGGIAGTIAGSIAGPKIGMALGSTLGVWLGTYACAAFTQPTPAPTPLPAYKPGPVGGGNPPGYPPYDGGTWWTFPGPNAPIPCVDTGCGSGTYPPDVYTQSNGYWSQAGPA